MITRTLARRLERLEEQMIREGDPKVWEIVVVDSAGTRAPILAGDNQKYCNRGATSLSSSSSRLQRATRNVESL